jgi:hypothetical protein
LPTLEFKKFGGDIRDWLTFGDSLRKSMARWDEEHYLPHRPVVKESGTTRVRRVFDVLARERGHPSLNQCLEKGMNLIEIILTLLLHLRLQQIES